MRAALLLVAFAGAAHAQAHTGVMSASVAELTKVYDLARYTVVASYLGLGATYYF